MVLGIYADSIQMENLMERVHCLWRPCPEELTIVQQHVCGLETYVVML